MNQRLHAVVAPASVATPAPARDHGSAAEAAARDRVIEDQAVRRLAGRLFHVDPEDPAQQLVAGIVTVGDVRHALRAAFRAGRSRL